MNMNVGKELAVLQRMSVGDLRSRYAEVFGETTNTRHKDWLVKRYPVTEVEIGGRGRVGR